MNVSCQDAIIDFIVSPAAFDGQGPVCRIDTHFSVISMAGDRVLKLKRAVTNDLLDYGTPERRHRACLAELEINRRTAPSLYRDVVPVTRDDAGELHLGGDGQPLDWVLVMRRFDENGLFLDLARKDLLSPELIDQTADAVARLHSSAEPTPERGGLEDMRWIVEGNLEALSGSAAEELDPALVADLASASHAALERLGGLLERRRQGGATRRCHGDLHLGNICLVDGAPTPFDAVEFNDRISCCDPLYDLAFLVMDLWARHHHDHANRILNRYLWHTADWEGLPLLPLFLSCRAAIRAKTSIWSAAVQDDARAAAAQRSEAAEYLDLALVALQRPACSLLALGGLSGSGKTTLAMALAARRPGMPGALVVRSDVVRKQLAGVPFDHRLGRHAYDSESSAKVYRQVETIAEGALAAGLSVIADAVFLRREERETIASVARRAECRFEALWLEAPGEQLKERVARRRGDASDADEAVVAFQVSQDAQEIAWPRIDASGKPETVASRAQRVL